MSYFVENEYYGANEEYYEITNECFPWKPTHWSWFSNLHYNQSKSESLHGACQSEDKWKLTIAEE